MRVGGLRQAVRVCKSEVRGVTTMLMVDDDVRDGVSLTDVISWLNSTSFPVTSCKTSDRNKVRIQTIDRLIR
jgi:hypothetical protein